MDLTFFQQHHLIIVLLACIVIGVVLKKWIADLENKYIPTVLTILGAVMCVAVNKSPTLEYVVYGAIIGLSSTGIHQMYKQLSEDGKKNILKALLDNLR